MKKILILFVVLFSLISVERLHTVEAVSYTHLTLPTNSLV